MFINNFVTVFVLSLLVANAIASPTPNSHILIPRDDSIVDINVLTNRDGTFQLTFSQKGVTQGYLIQNTPNSTYPYHFVALDGSGLGIDPVALLDGSLSDGPQLMFELASLAQQFGQA